MAISVLRYVITILFINKQICFLGIVYICVVCNLLLSFCCDYFIRKSRYVSSPNLFLYLGCFFAKIFFSFALRFVRTYLFLRHNGRSRVYNQD